MTTRRSAPASELVRRHQPLIVPDRDDHVQAAELRNCCRRAGVQIGTIDALLGQLCIRHDLTMLSADNHFKQLASQCALKVWGR